ncbi:DegT/DnrJ/EryC1/StrS aminotransferase family protein [Candidatus Gottesmanbacteria bacterium]|nr:DegT/DnrJ/EryC1/StrS aminotransferase family protein [Candidatus Gottesmanbacteria bacterium]
MLLTSSAHFAQYVRMLRAHGASTTVTNRHLSKKVMHEQYPIIGYNYRMSDIHAALGVAQFHKLDFIMKRRKEIAMRYNKAFEGNHRIVIPFVPKGFTHTYQSYQIRLPGLAKYRTHIMQKLLDAGIATRGGVMASHLEKPYRKMYPRLRLPETEKASRETLILPLFTVLSTSDQNYVIDNLLKVLKTI